jgi:hypothetical protein
VIYYKSNFGGSPFSVRAEDAPHPDLSKLEANYHY